MNDVEAMYNVIKSIAFDTAAQIGYDITKYGIVASKETNNTYTITIDGTNYSSTKAIGDVQVGMQVPVLLMGGNINSRIILGCDNSTSSFNTQTFSKNLLTGEITSTAYIQSEQITITDMNNLKDSKVYTVYTNMSEVSNTPSDIFNRITYYTITTMPSYTGSEVIQIIMFPGDQTYPNPTIWIRGLYHYILQEETVYEWTSWKKLAYSSSVELGAGLKYDDDGKITLDLAEGLYINDEGKIDIRGGEVNE